MLKINNIKLKKCKFPLILIFISISGVFLFQYLTFIPKYSYAESISTIEPKKTLDSITYMSELTPEICGNTKTPDAFLSDGTTINPDVPTKQLIDGREGNNGTKYWVSKLADGNCWTVQNLAYDINGLSDNYKTKKNKIIAPININDPTNYTEIDITNKAPSENPLMSTAIDGNSYNAHYSIGNYYNLRSSNLQATQACDFSGRKNTDWKLPTSPSAADVSAEDGSLSKLLGSYNIANNADGSKMLRKPPFYFLYSGDYYNNKLMDFGTAGFYWSSTPNMKQYGGAYYYQLDLYDNFANPQGFYYGATYGFSARCVVVANNTAVTPDDNINHPTATVTIPPILTLSVSDSVDIDTKASDISEGNFTTTVSSNNHYTISLSTIPNGHTDLQHNTNPTGPSIPALSSTITEANDSWWGIKCTNPTPSSSTQTCTKPNYTGLTTAPVTYFTSTTGASTQSAVFNIGVKTSPSLPSGTYSTSIQVTASQK